MAAENGTTQQVVVGVDGSAESIAALKWAASYATATGAHVRAVIAWHFPAAVGSAPIGVAPKPVSDEVRESMIKSVHDAIAEAGIAPDLVDVGVEYGHPAQVLVDQSAKADLLVVGSHGHGKFTGMLVGSVSIHCVTHAACPVLVARAKS
jgi:nucleotide-binding universal stress UspA family protein